MQIHYDRGIYFEKEKNIVIDSCIKSHKADHAIVSHAHSDHVKLNNTACVLATKQTLALLKNSHNIELKNYKPLAFGEKLKLNNTEISLHNSGHILGSSQILIQNSKSLAITSDFKMNPSLTEEPATPLKADTLLIESTFGLPQYSFPSREIVYAKMAAWIKEELSRRHFIVLGGYALGKSQELTKFCNEFLGVAPIVHEKIYCNNKIYESEGTSLGTYFKLNHNLSDSNILIMPPSLINNHLLQALQFSLKKKVAAANFSGWQYHGCYDKIFPLSDHADFSQLMQYIQETEPKQVLTMHGFENEFARYVNRRLKIPARSLNAKQAQNTLFQY